MSLIAHLIESTDQSSETFYKNTQKNLLEYLKEQFSQISRKKQKKIVALHKIHYLNWNWYLSLPWCSGSFSELIIFRLLEMRNICLIWDSYLSYLRQFSACLGDLQLKQILFHIQYHLYFHLFLFYPKEILSNSFIFSLKLNYIRKPKHVLTLETLGLEISSNNFYENSNNQVLGIRFVGELVRIKHDFCI